MFCSFCHPPWKHSSSDRDEWKEYARGQKLNWTFYTFLDKAGIWRIAKYRGANRDNRINANSRRLVEKFQESVVLYRFENCIETHCRGPLVSSISLMSHADAWLLLSIDWFLYSSKDISFKFYYRYNECQDLWPLPEFQFKLWSVSFSSIFWEKFIERYTRFSGDPR